MDISNAYGQMVPMALHYTTTMTSLKLHGETNTMVSRQIQNLSQEDLSYLETLLGREFANINQRKQAFKTKNGWCPEESDTKKLLRLMNAIRAQKSIKKATSEKW